MSGLPPHLLGPGALAAAAPRLVALARGARALIVADAFWGETPSLAGLAGALEAAGLTVEVRAEIAGEPGAAAISALAEAARGAGLVVGLGGGAALDAAKAAAACAGGAADPMAYALCVRPLPRRAAALALVPTTAGTGSEANGTAVFSDAGGRKLWLHGDECRADLAILDPDLLADAPPLLMAACGMDAFVHAFEAATNRNAQPLASFFALRALALISGGALARAVADPRDRDAAGEMLLAAFYAGHAIENAGTAVAHNVSHALAGFAPAPHGLVTALAFEATLPFVLAARTPAVMAAAAACGHSLESFPGWLSSLMRRIGIAETLPPAFASVPAAALAAEMRAEAHAPMRRATVPDLDDAAIDRIAAEVLRRAPPRAVAS